MARKKKVEPVEVKEEPTKSSVEINPEILSIFHSVGVYLPNKTYYLSGACDQDMLDQFVKNFIFLDSFEGDITIIINSPGGDINIGKAIYDLIKNSENHVNILALGEVASCGTIIMMAGDTRYITPSSRLVLHLGADATPYDHPVNNKERAKAYEEDTQWMLKVYTDRINQVRKKKDRLTKEQLEKDITFDRYFNAKQAVDYGLVDYIVE